MKVSVYYSPKKKTFVLRFLARAIGATGTRVGAMAPLKLKKRDGKYLGGGKYLAYGIIKFTIKTPQVCHMHPPLYANLKLILVNLDTDLMQISLF